MQEQLNRWFDALVTSLREAKVTDQNSNRISLEAGCEWWRKTAHEAHDAGNKLIFIGNGGSASIASHLAIDFSKNGGLRALAFNDPSALTCLGNDLGYHNVFSKQLDFHARPGDLLIAISSSGQSQNILEAVKMARSRGCKVVTYSGFSENNELRKTGDINFYVSANENEYGFVEVAHLALCHVVLDVDMGWGTPGGLKMPSFA